MNEKERLYEKLQELREQVKNNEKAMQYYEHLKEINNGDMLYGWEFQNNAILEDTIEDLDLYQDAYVRDIFRVYIGELEMILYKVNL